MTEQNVKELLELRAQISRVLDSVIQNIYVGNEGDVVLDLQNAEGKPAYKLTINISKPKDD